MLKVTGIGVFRGVAASLYLAQRSVSPQRRKRSRGAAFRAALVACSAALCVTAPAPAATSVPFTVKEGMVLVMASLDGAPEQPMLVDLGAGLAVLASSAAKQTAFSPVGVFTASRMRGDQVRSPIGTISSIAIGPIVDRNPIVSSWSGLDGHGIAGLLSAVQFRSLPVTFDFVNHLLVFEDAASLASRSAISSRTPLALLDDRGLALTLFARFDFGSGHSGLCEIDTGSQGFYLDQHFAHELGLDPATQRAVLPSLSLTGTSAAVTNAKVRFEKLIYDCNIGNDFWAGRVFTIDIPNRVLYV